ncbi:histidine kinase [Aliifodinibius salipaludis]|uniref:Histidine kinase n=1 Tax=Fodinibius salipaludis TaxID=2032627 RepID=A0A2A2GED0_9BACT|nr:PAS domain S-box protein [Aliifodinibius salipaludis]PAU95570.1 histidine kinase [Aliifodinibius salipaludis]
MKHDQKTEVPNSGEILEEINQCVISTDLNGIVDYWNSACEQIFGYSNAEMINKSLQKIYPSVATERYDQHIRQLRTGQEVKGQWKSITKGGDIIWIDVHAKPLMDEGGDPQAIIASAHDIGELKRVERELEENKARAQAILETTVDGIFTTDIEGQILNFNHSASRMFGYSEDEITGKSVNILIPRFHDNDDFVNWYSETSEKRVIGYRRELIGRHKNGSTFPLELSVSEIEWQGNRIFTGVVNNISDRRRLEREILRISEEERRNLGHDLHDGLGQMLTGIHLISKNLAQKLKSNGFPCSDEVKEISDLIKEADEYAKALAHGLVQVNFVEEGLDTVLNQLARQVEKLFNINCSVDFKDDIKLHNNMQGMHLYRIAQESISNAVKHGKANNINIEIKTENGFLKLLIRDDGIGFSESQKQTKKAGMGINIMGYRANILSGRIEIFETEEETKVLCTIPFNK